jgi:hypothetical protein
MREVRACAAGGGGACFFGGGEDEGGRHVHAHPRAKPSNTFPFSRWLTSNPGSQLLLMNSRMLPVDE